MMNNNKKSQQNVNFSLSRSDDKHSDSDSEWDESTSRNVEEKIDTVNKF